MTATNRENVWTVLGPEFGENAGESAIIVRALSGLKSVGASLRAHFAQSIWELGYESYKIDPDLWLKSKTRPEDKFEFYSYMLFYVYDIFCINDDPNDALNKLNHYVQLMPG